MDFCTVSDKTYLYKGLAMYMSLCQHYKGEIKLHWLCIDNDIYDILIRINRPEIIPYKLETLETDYPELQYAKTLPPSEYGTQYQNYCWALTPWFNYYLLNAQVDNKDSLMYVDSDIFFLQSPQRIIETIGTMPIGIHTHRFSGTFKESSAGWYNVGVVYFKNDNIGRACSYQWKNWCVRHDHEYYKTHGTCGDQKYLELFSTKFGAQNVCVFDQDTTLTHLAPWCTDFEVNKHIMFYHFSHFRHDFKTNQWFDSLHGEWAPAEQPGIRKYYEEYFKMLLFTRSIIIPGLSIVGNLKIDETNPERLHYLLCTLHSFKFIKYQCEVFLNFEGCSPRVQQIIQHEFNEIGFQGGVSFITGNYYGHMYTYLLEQCKNEYILNFMEDHFCVLKDPQDIFGLLKWMEITGADVLKASFFEIEQNSIKPFIQYKNANYGTVFNNSPENFKAYCRHYGKRYYIGVNFITTKAFAEKFWRREFESSRPHEWEIVDYDPAFLHTVMVPNRPVLVAIDDDHGEQGTALVNKLPQNDKFFLIYNIVFNKMQYYNSTAAKKIETGAPFDEALK